MDLTIVGCPVAHLGMVAHKGSFKTDLIKLIPDDAVIVSRKKESGKVSV